MLVGVSLSEAAVKVGVSNSTRGVAARRIGFRRMNNRRPDPKWDKVDWRMCSAEIARQMRISIQRIELVRGRREGHKARAGGFGSARRCQGFLVFRGIHRKGERLGVGLSEGERVTYDRLVR